MPDAFSATALRVSMECGGLVGIENKHYTVGNKLPSPPSNKYV